MVMSEHECPLGLNEEGLGFHSPSTAQTHRLSPHRHVCHFASPALAPSVQHSPPAAADADNSPRTAQVQRSPPWSDLPPELLGLLFLRLPKRADRAFFTAVCRAWCSAARQCRLPPPSPVPWLVLPDGSATSFPRGETFQLPDGVHHHASCGEWLLLSCRDGSCFLFFTKATMPLPNLSSYSYYEEPVEVQELAEDEEPWTWMDNKDRGVISILSLVVCSTRLIAAILAIEDIGTIALCRPGAAAWSVSAHRQCMFLSQMLFFQGKLYAIDNNIVGAGEHLITIDIVDENGSDEPKVSEIEHLIFRGAYMSPLKHSRWIRYLVESHGKLLVIRREHLDKRQDGTVVAGSNECQVFEADFEQRLWAEVTTLGNSQALFVGQRYSRAVHVSPYDVSRDCIFFLDDCPNWLVKHTTGSCGVYDMTDEKVYSPLPMVSWKSKEVPATWIFSQCETDNKLQTEGEGSQETVEPR